MWVARRALLVDVCLTVAIAWSIHLAIGVANEPRSRPVDATAFTFGALMAVPLLVRRRWPLGVLLATTGVLVTYYASDYPGISPVLPLAVPLYTATAAGHLRWAVAIPSVISAAGLFVVGERKGVPFRLLLPEFIPHFLLMAGAIALGEVVRSRRALAAETRERLRLAAEDRDREAARRVVEERLRIARELHDTVAHSMATIAVQAGGALRVLAERPDDVRTALTAIRDTSKGALGEMRATLGVLRRGGEAETYDAAGLDRLPALLDAVRAAGVPVTFETSGPAEPLDALVDHAAYRILQESLTNVLRHAGSDVSADVRLSYGPSDVAVEITDDGVGVEGDRPVDGGGHGLGGMRERAETVGGVFTAGPRPGGGFAVSARLPRTVGEMAAD